MNIVILHCHLERGGVTQVIENHVGSLVDSDEVDRIVLVSGPRASGLSPSVREAVTHVVLDGFDYDDQAWGPSQLEARGRETTQKLHREMTSLGLEASETVLHWHNHSLGKNTIAPRVVTSMADQGWRLLLQIHDFAEDNRPENCLRLIRAIGATQPEDLDRYLYPVAEQIDYCTLTNADAEVLVDLGIPNESVRCLPNSVVAPVAGPGATEDPSRVLEAFGLPAASRWCLYPVRGIRRKNVGELLLLSQLAADDQFFGLTLCPATPIERRSYERWRQVAGEVAPRTIFDAGEHPDISFFANLNAADCVVSTSVAEGFGMAFLEPWLLGREVIARRLPTVAGDFEANGMSLSRFYGEIPIPGDASWISECRSQFNAAIQHAWTQLPNAFHPTQGRNDGSSDGFDFARLSPQLQIETLRRVASDVGFRDRVISSSPSLVDSLQSERDPALIAANAAVVESQYSPRVISGRLLSLYRDVLGSDATSEVGSPVNAGSGFQLVNRARPFFPCRTEVLSD